MKNFLFIDDSGSKNWDTPYSADFIDNPPARTPQNRLFWQNNYFVLAGLYINEENLGKIDELANQAKIETFGTKYVELHSSDLRNPHKMREKYLEPYGITLERLTYFIENRWYPLFDTNTMQLFAIIVDKRYFKNGRHMKMPLDIAARALFDRTELHPYEHCEITFDQMDSQIKSQKHDQGKIFEIANTRIVLSDGKYKNKYNFASVSFEKSCNSNFLQLADMVVYNVLRQFVDYGDEWDTHSPFGQHRQLPTYSYFERISKYFYHSEKGQLNGYGIVKLPDPNNGKLKPWLID